VSPSILDLFVLSLFDRGLETPYDLQRQAGVSLGSSVTALRRLEAAGFIKKRKAVATSKRPRHSYQLSTAGRNLAQNGWKTHLKTPTQMDLDAVLKVTDMAQHYRAKAADIVEFLAAVISERKVPARSRLSNLDGMRSSLGHMNTLEAWNLARLKAEVKFLAGLSESVTSTGVMRSKR
jgi:DNA-binding PadR family transcriptional regulator